MKMADVKSTLSNIRLSKDLWYSRDMVVTLLLCLTAILVVRAMLPVRVDPNLTVVVSKNRTVIQNLNQPRNIETSKEVSVDVLNLANENQFSHPQLGNVGYGANFFADVETQFVIRREGNYRFVVASDDGFSLDINGERLCQFMGQRALSAQTCTVHLEEGEHHFQLAYFQAGGPAGLTVRYGIQGERRLYWFGENSRLMRIKR